MNLRKTSTTYIHTPYEHIVFVRYIYKRKHRKGNNKSSRVHECITRSFNKQGIRGSTAGAWMHRAPWDVGVIVLSVILGTIVDCIPTIRSGTHFPRRE